MISIKPIRLGLIALTLTGSLYTVELAAQVTPDHQQPTTPTLEAPQDNTAPESAKAQLLRLDRLTFLLSGYEHFPSRAELDGVGSDDQISALLIEVAAGQAQSATLRLRAVDAMGYYNQPSIIAHLNALIAQDQAPQDKQALRLWRSMRRHAVLSLARAQGQAALKSLSPLLKPEQDFQLQLTLISAIGKHTGAAGLKTLRAYRQTPSLDPLIIQALHKHLRD